MFYFKYIVSSEKSICKGLANTEFCEEDTEKSSSGIEEKKMSIAFSSQRHVENCNNF